MKRIFVKGLVAVFFVVFLSSSAMADRPIRILIIDPLSGPFKIYGERFVLGWKLAAEEANAHGGLMGRKVEVIAEDDQFKPEIALRTLQKYIMEGDVDFVNQSLASHIAQALIDLTAKNNIVFINTAMADLFAEKRFSYNSVQLVYRTAMMARLLVTYINEHKPFKKFYLINPDYAYGRDIAKMFENEISRIIPDAEIVGNVFHPMSAKDLSSILTKVKASKAECILSGSYGPALSIMIKQRHELGVPAVIVNNSLADPVYIREIGEAAIGCIVSDCWMSTVANEKSDAFRESWRKKYGDTEWAVPDNVSGRTYAAAKFLFNGIEKAKSVEVNKLIPILEGMHQNNINGDVYLRACTHTLQSPLPVGEVVSSSPPFYSVPTMVPAEKIAIEKEKIDNPRCK